MQKRVAAIHDISCLGRCSLTVALPIISAAGIECSVLPTAVLSTHTGGFTGFTYRDLTDDILPIADHWRELGIGFDALYTGFLGSFGQIAIVSELFERFKTDENIVLVDPVMADNGELYKIFPPDFPSGMRKLCEQATVIIPNITEAISLSDRIVVLTRRPAMVRNIHTIEIGTENRTPMKSREAPEFRKYFNKIWKELDVHV